MYIASENYLSSSLRASTLTSAAQPIVSEQIDKKLRLKTGHIKPGPYRTYNGGRQKSTAERRNFIDARGAKQHQRPQGKRTVTHGHGTQKNGYLSTSSGHARSLEHIPAQVVNLTASEL